MGIVIKSDKEIATMREAGRITAEVLRILQDSIKPGMKTIELDMIAEKELKRLGATSSFKGYRGYPAHLRGRPDLQRGGLVRFRFRLPDRHAAGRRRPLRRGGRLRR